MGGMKSTPASAAGTAREGLLKYTEAQTVASQRLCRIAPVRRACTDETYARVLTGALRVMKAVGAEVTAHGTSDAPTPEVDVDVDVRLRRRRRRLGLRRLGHRAAADREGLPGRRARGRAPLRGRRLRRRTPGTPRTTCGPPQLGCYGIQRIHLLPRRHGAGRRGRRRRLAELRQHPLRAADAVLPATSSGPTSPTGRASSPRTTTRRGRMLGRASPTRATASVERAHAAHRRRPGGRRHFRMAPVGVFFGTARRRRRRRSSESRYFGGVGPRAHRLHRVRQLHDRLPGGRQEHAAQELPRARREPRRRRSTPMRTVTRLGVVPGTGGRARGITGCCTSAPAPATGATAQVVTRPPRRAGRRHLGHPDAAARHEGRRASCRGCRTASAHRTRTNSEALLGAHDAARYRSGDRRPSTSRGRGDHLVVPPRRHHPHRELSATARAPTRWACSPRSPCPAARGGRAGSSCCATVGRDPMGFLRARCRSRGAGASG